MPLKDLRCDFKPERDAEILKSIKTLETINGKPAKGFWAEVDAKKASDSDRTAAEWVLSIGGVVRVLLLDGQDWEIRATGDLPREAFRLVSFGLDQNAKVSDAGLAHFKDCKNVTELHLWGCRRGSDAGLAHFKDCKNVTVRDLGYTQVSDRGLAYFRGCKTLKSLNMSGNTQVSEEGLASFQGCKNLTYFILWGCSRVSDAGLAHFKDCKNVQVLNLGGTQVGDEGLASFQGCKYLTELHLWGTKVNDAGLAHFKDCKNMAILYLNNTQAGDEGLAYFNCCKNLNELHMRGCSRVSDSGLAHFKDCKNLTILNLGGTKVTDLSPLKGMSLKELSCDLKPERDTEILKSIKTLETINDKPAKEFWKEVDAKKP